MISKILHYLFFIFLAIGIILVGFNQMVWAERCLYFVIATVILWSGCSWREQ